MPPLSSSFGRAALAGLLLLLASGCQPAADPQNSGPSPDDCLRNVSMDQLPQALERCNAVVQAFPANPQPRNERALLHSLAGDQQASCRDSQAAAALLQPWRSRHSVDPVLVEEINLRRRSCAALTTPRATGAPSGARPGAAER
ncbi:MAG: hypothetical protein EBX49_07685 [Synechococcaceae bacterium WB8_1B_136]|nr:hypothetical protein [Synechococcaceae bacterium WB8_1B_136]